MRFLDQVQVLRDLFRITRDLQNRTSSTPDGARSTVTIWLCVRGSQRPHARRLREGQLIGRGICAVKAVMGGHQSSDSEPRCAMEPSAALHATSIESQSLQRPGLRADGHRFFRLRIAEPVILRGAGRLSAAGRRGDRRDEGERSGDAEDDGEPMLERRREQVREDLAARQDPLCFGRQRTERAGGL
jgi:hypothetical protein